MSSFHHQQKRLFSSLEDKSESLLVMKRPKGLSPTSASVFKGCPQSFMFQYLLEGIKQPITPVLVKGSLCHKALESLYSYEAIERTLDNLYDLFRNAWRDVRSNDPYDTLFPNVDEERVWGQSALQLLQNYYNLEDPKSVVTPNPIEREIWVTARLSIDPAQGVTSTTKRNVVRNEHSLNNNTNNNNNNTNNTHEDDQDDNQYEDKDTEDEGGDTFMVRGIVDRLDMVRLPSLGSNPCLRIVDYKTGKAPDLKYLRAMNDQIASEQFWQLKVYALLLREMLDPSSSCNKEKKRPKGLVSRLQTLNIPVRSLRLLYLTTGRNPKEGHYFELDLGEDETSRDELLHPIHVELTTIWKQILQLWNTHNVRSFVHCDRTWCFCHVARSNFEPGTFWERTPPPP